jgi:NADH:ubiquinone oxidoreductase subunit F (NADH-binding)
MLPKKARREEVLRRLSEAGGLRPGAAGEVHRQTGVPEADVFGAASFYTLLTDPDSVRVCQGLSCCLHGCEEVKARLEAEGRKAVYASCLGRCDAAPAVWDPHGEIELPATGLTPSEGPYELALDLAAPDAFDPAAPYPALAAARERGADWVVGELEAAGLTGRGGAGFPAHVKWNGVRRQPVTERYVVLNADEGEPGTFKDREVMLRRPHLVIEGLAVAAVTLGAQEVWIYVRGEFPAPRLALEAALAEAADAGALPGGVAWHFHEGHGAYICGEETALLESLEGKRGMPRMKPPFPVEVGLRGKPTLIQNVETIACLPAILARGGAWFRRLGRTEAGTKLYCLSGHVVRPGVYEAPMGVTLNELLELAGGADGELKAFSPGGASSGFLPADRADVPLDFKALAAEGSMLGSAGIVVLNETADMAAAALAQAVFFEDESCGQCSPCRIGTRVLRRALERYRESGDPAVLAEVDEVAWGMTEASICGLGQAAPLPLTSVLEHFPAALGRPPAAAPGPPPGEGTEPAHRAETREGLQGGGGSET